MLAKYTLTECLDAFRSLIRLYNNAPYVENAPYGEEEDCVLCVLDSKYFSGECAQCPYMILFRKGCNRVDTSRFLTRDDMLEEIWDEERDRPIAKKRIKFLERCIKFAEEHPELFKQETEQ